LAPTDADAGGNTSMYPAWAVEVELSGAKRTPPTAAFADEIGSHKPTMAVAAPTVASRVIQCLIGSSSWF
jgi:hypothetical protein